MAKARPSKKKPVGLNGSPYKKTCIKKKGVRPSLPPIGDNVWVNDPDGGYDAELLQILVHTCRVETTDGRILRPLTEWLSHTDNFDLAVCRERGLTDDTIRENRLRTEGDAMIIPFRNLAGEMNGFARKRHHAPPIINGKPAKFTQPKGSPVRPYFPVASLEKLRDCFSPVFITESDLKAMVLAQLDLAGVGLTGVNCWNEKGTDNLIPDLQDIRWRDRIVYICFDYDEKEVTRRTVRAAMRRLARALRLLGAEVYFVDLPPAEDGGKQGVDDFIVANGAEAFHDLIEQAQPVPDEEISLINLISLTPPTLAEEAYHGFRGEFI